MRKTSREEVLIILIISAAGLLGKHYTPISPLSDGSNREYVNVSVTWACMENTTQVRAREQDVSMNAQLWPAAHWHFVAVKMTTDLSHLPLTINGISAGGLSTLGSRGKKKRKRIHAYRLLRSLFSPFLFSSVCFHEIPFFIFMAKCNSVFGEISPLRSQSKHLLNLSIFHLSH